MAPISLDKQYRTRDGREVKLWFIDGDHVLGAHLVQFRNDEPPKWQATSWHVSNGRWLTTNPSPYDLVEDKPRIKLELMVRVRRHLGSGAILVSLEGSSDDRVFPEDKAKLIACVPIVIDCDEGTGL